MIFLSAILWESLREVTFGSERQAKEKGEQKTENRKQSQEIKRDSSHKKRAMEKSSSLRGLCSEWCGAGFVMEEQIAPRETQTREGFSRSADVGSGGSGWGVAYLADRLRRRPLHEEPKSRQGAGATGAGENPRPTLKKRGWGTRHAGQTE